MAKRNEIEFEEKYLNSLQNVGFLCAPHTVISKQVTESVVPAVCDGLISQVSTGVVDVKYPPWPLTLRIRFDEAINCHTIGWPINQRSSQRFVCTIASAYDVRNEPHPAFGPCDQLRSIMHLRV